MRFLNLMLGRSESEPTFELSKNRYEGAYAVAVREAELDAFERLIRLESETDGTTEEASEAVERAFDDVLRDESVDFDPEAVAEQIREPGRNASVIVEAFRETTTDDVDVVYASPRAYPALLSFVEHCTRRANLDADSFELPNTASEARLLLARLEAAHENPEHGVYVYGEWVADVPEETSAHPTDPSGRPEAETE